MDAFLSPADDVKAMAAAIARERGWPDEWLNDKVLMYKSHYDTEDDWKVLLVDGNVTVRVASAELLLAMKLLAGRGQRDGNDIDQTPPCLRREQCRGGRGGLRALLPE